jgi:hypothetical protein
MNGARFAGYAVLDPAGDGKIVGMVALNDLLHARTRTLKTSAPARECRGIRMPFGRRMKEQRTTLTEGTDFATDLDPTIHENGKCMVDCCRPMHLASFAPWPPIY